MNDDQVAALIRMVKALCPAQRFDEYTPDAWLLVLDDIPFEAAVAALKPLARSCRFIAPADIADEIRRQRAARPDSKTLDEALTVPDADPDDVRGYLAALRAGTVRPPVLGTRRPVAALISGAFHRVPDAHHTDPDF
jgi:hypothetical protein